MIYVQFSVIRQPETDQSAKTFNRINTNLLLKDDQTINQRAQQKWEKNVVVLRLEIADSINPVCELFVCVTQAPITTNVKLQLCKTQMWITVLIKQIHNSKPNILHHKCFANQF